MEVWPLLGTEVRIQKGQLAVGVQGPVGAEPRLGAGHRGRESSSGEGPQVRAQVWQQLGAGPGLRHTQIRKARDTVWKLPDLSHKVLRRHPGFLS